MTDPTPLSPAAQAVLNAFRAVPDLRDCPSIAAALRAAANEMSREWGYYKHHDFLRDIAAELEGSND